MRNVALNCNITSNASPYYNYKPTKAVDGNLDGSDGFMTDAFAYDSHAKLTLDLGTAYNITSINLKQLLYGGARRCKDFTLEYSTDNKNFQVISSGSMLDNDELQCFPVDCSNQYRYWRFTILTNQEGRRDKGIGEIELIAIEQVYMLEKQNKYYTINDDLSITELENINKDYVFAKGFKEISLVNKIDTSGYSLIACPIKDNAKVQLEYSFKEPIQPIDSFTNFEIYRKHFI